MCACNLLSAISHLQQTSSRTHNQSQPRQTMWDNQLPPSMKPFKMGDIVFSASDFGLGFAIQNKYAPLMAILGEAGWGGAASTNWWASPSTDTVIVIMTQVAPFFNGLAGEVKPIVYTSLMDWEPSASVVVGPGGEREDGTPLTDPTEEQAALVGIGPIPVEGRWLEEAAVGATVDATGNVRRGSLKGSRVRRY